MPVFNTYFSRGGAGRHRNRNWAAFYLGAFFTTPTLIVYVMCDPRILQWFVDEYQPMVYHAAADPKIISDIVQGKKPTAISPGRPEE